MSQNKPWLEKYPNGIPVNVDINQYSTLVEYFDKKCSEYSNQVAFSCMGKEMSYKKTQSLANDFGAYLQSRGLKPGDKIALMMPNMLQYPIALFGALKAGLVIVNTNPLYTPREMEHQFTDSDVSAIIIAENFAANLEKIIAKTNINVVITTAVGDLLGAVKGTLVNFVIKNVKRVVPKFNLENTVNFKEALAAGKKFKLAPVEDSVDRVIVHQYTGGTTGVSKGAMLTNKNLISNLIQMAAWFKPSMTGDNIVMLTALPLYHIFAFSVNCLSMMNFGAKNILITNPRDLPGLIKEMDKQKITAMTGVNTLFNALLNNEAFRTMDLSNLKISMGGGTAVQVAVNQRWLELTGHMITEGFGMTEASPVVTTNPFNEDCRMGCIGLPLPSTDVRIADENDIPLPPGEIGEIQVQGPQVMLGYYNRAEETAKTIRNGWLCTGDIGIMDKDGYFKIVDRKKDMILVSGFNVYPNEIENVVALHDKVLECGAIGIPSEKSGEMVKIFVVKKDESLTKEELIQHCRENLTGYKIPKEVAFIKELPKSTVGKILRKELRTL